MTHVYQFALRRASDKKKQFIIESDLVYTDEKIQQETVNELAEKHKCDIRVTYLGLLKEAKKEEILEATYHTKEMIEKTIFDWKEEEREAFTNGISEDFSI